MCIRDRASAGRQRLRQAAHQATRFADHHEVKRCRLMAGERITPDEITPDLQLEQRVQQGDLKATCAWLMTRNLMDEPEILGGLTAKVHSVRRRLHITLS